MKDTNLDFVTPNGVEGAVAKSLQNVTDVSMKRPFLHTDENGVQKSYVSVYTGEKDKDGKKLYKAVELQANTKATLRRDEWVQFDEAVVAVNRSRLGGIADLESRNLTYNLTNAMGTTSLQWETMSDGMEATISMDGVTRSQNDKVQYEVNTMPIPILHSDFEISGRELEASRRLGNPLDTTQAEQGTRRIMETLEKMLFGSVTYRKGGGTIYGYTTHPDRCLATSTASWLASWKSPKDIVADVVAMKGDLIAKGFHGPYVLYLPTHYETLMDMDYSTITSGTSDTIRQRILKIAGIEDVKVSDYLTDHNVILVQMTSDVIRLVNGIKPQVIEWAEEGGMIFKYKVLAIQVPQIRSTQTGQCGVCHWTYDSQAVDPGETDPEPGTISVDPVSGVEFAATGEDKQVTVTASGEYEVASKPDWITAVIGEGKVTLTAEVNPGEVRTGNVVLSLKSDESVTATIAVTQLAGGE